MARIEATLKSHETTLQSEATCLENLEVQVGQIVNMLNSRKPRIQLRNTKVNLREYVNAIMLISGKELNELKAKKKIKEKKNVAEEESSNKVQKPNKDKVILGRIHFLDNSLPYVPPIPYPQGL